jgi:hypothetical protein
MWMLWDQNLTGVPRLQQLYVLTMQSCSVWNMLDAYATQCAHP